MKKASVETGVGIFVLIGLICVAYLTIKLGQMEWFGNNYYSINARFDSVSGLKDGAPVDIAGVEIGRVADIHLDKQRDMAIVSLKIRKDIKLNDDVIASVKTSGLIGDKYIRLTPGASGRILKPGGTIIDTESPVDIEDLIGKYAFGSAGKK
jgi:phospholipid/cholesterol/gamma-HCH transport system substrate-binding protein